MAHEENLVRETGTWCSLLCTRVGCPPGERGCVLKSGHDGNCACLEHLRANTPSNDTRALEVEGAAVIAAFDETEFATSRCRALLDWSRRALAAVEVAAQKLSDANAVADENGAQAWRYLGSMEVAMGALERIQDHRLRKTGVGETICNSCLRFIVSRVPGKPSEEHDEGFSCGIARRALATLRSGVAPGEARPDECDQCGKRRPPDWRDDRCPHHALPEPYSSCDGVLRPAAPAAQRRLTTLARERMREYADAFTRNAKLFSDHATIPIADERMAEAIYEALEADRRGTP